MAEKQQQRVTTSTKNKAMNSKDDKVTNKAGKKPLRLDERKQLEIEKKKTHKMMRQISDSESSIDEQPQDDDGSGKVKNSIVADSEDDTKSGKKIAKEKLLKRKTMRYNRSTSSASSDSIPTFNFDESDRKKKSFSADSDSDNERPSRKGGKPPATNKNGNLLNGGTSSTGIAAGKRKLLSSAPTKKPTAIESKLVNGHNNGTTTETNEKKRGPKPVEEKKGPGRTRKNTVGSTNSSVAASTRSAAGGKKKAENGKPGRKAGTTNGRGKKNAAASDNEDDEEKNNNSDAESDLGDVRPVTKPMNGGTVVKGKRGRKAGTGKKQLAAETDTVMEDWTGGKGDPEKCAHEECKRPKEMSINWVQCDDCDGWFHSICVFGKNTMPKEEEKWYCVACQPNHGNSSISLDEAASTSNNSTLHT